MVLHGDGGLYTNSLNYRNRQHREYRTTLHLIFQMLQPRLHKDPHGWDQAADIWNHIFHADLIRDNVRFQRGKHWRDQYYHRFAEGRPKEWREIDAPDDTLDAAEIARRQAFAANIRQAAQALGILLPNAYPAYLGAAAPAQALMHAAPLSAAPGLAAPMGAMTSNDGDQMDDEENAGGESVVGEKEMNDEDIGRGRMNVEIVDDEKMDDEEMDEGMDEEAMFGAKSKLKQTIAVPQPHAPKRKRGPHNDSEDFEGYEGLELVVKQRRRKVVSADGVNTRKSAGQASGTITLDHPKDHLFRPYDNAPEARRARAKMASDLVRSQTFRTSGDEEVLAYQPEGKASGSSNMTRLESAKAFPRQVNDSSATSREADEISEGSLADADGETDTEVVPAIVSTRRKMAVDNKAGLRSKVGQELAAPASSKMSPTHSSFGEQDTSENRLAFTTDTSPSIRDADRTPKIQKRSNLDRPKFIRSKHYEQTHGLTGKSAPAKARTTGSGLKQMESAEGAVGASSNKRASSSPAIRSSSASKISSAPSLSFAHSNTIKWYYDTPHATTSSNATMPGPNVADEKNVIPQHGGRAFRGVLDEVQKDFVICVAQECHSCALSSSDNLLSSRDAARFDRPFVHSCCVKHNDQYGSDEFKPVKGMEWHWNKPFTGAMRCGEVQFADNMTRRVFLCAGEVCKACKRYVETGSMAPNEDENST